LLSLPAAGLTVTLRLPSPIIETLFGTTNGKFSSYTPGSILIVTGPSVLASALDRASSIVSKAPFI